MIAKTGTPPTRQKDLPISLLMLGLTVGRWEYYFEPRPEDITYTHPTRASVVQTLGGAWVDDFGEGLVDIVLNGHTGWRALDAGHPLDDGMIKLYDLRHNLFEVYHQDRMAAAQDGLDPDDAVQLFLNDALHKIGFRVYPVSLQIRKNKSRPLLYQYQLRLTGLEKHIDSADQIT